MRLAWLLLGMPLAAACACGPRDPCGGCPGAQTCDLESRRCVKAIAVGQPCSDSDGGPLTLPCQEGTQCATSLTPPVCAQGCDPTQSQPGCPAHESCWTPLSAGGASGSTTTGFCGTVAAAGQGCGTVGLAVCDQGLGCIVTGPSATQGFCAAPCTAGSPDPCAAPAHCLAIFPDPTQGICALSIPPGASCNETSQLFCPQGQLCLTADGLDAGNCLVRCDPAADGGCPESQGCLTPLSDPSVGICAQPQPDGAPCDAATDLFCGRSSICIQDPTGPSCHALCGQAHPCPAPKSCLQVTGTGQEACG